MGMTVDMADKLIDKAKEKNSGVYSYKGVVYVVKNHNFVAYADPYGQIYQRFGIFDVVIGECRKPERKRVLEQWLKDN